MNEKNDDLEKMKAIFSAEEKREEERLESAKLKAKTLGKEVFDFAKLETFWRAQNRASWTEQDIQDESRDLEYQYYVVYPDILTLEGFGETLRDLDQYR